MFLNPNLLHCVLENLFPEVESELVALVPERPAERGRAAVEHGDLPLVLVQQLLEHLVPVGPAGVGARLEPRDEVPLLLLVQQVQRQLQPHGLHVGALEGRRDVHVHVQEPVQPLLGLLDLQLGEKVHEPLERALVAVDPEEVHFPEIHDA